MSIDFAHALATLGVHHVFGQMNSLTTKTQNLPPQFEISVCEGTLWVLVGAISIARRVTQNLDAPPRDT
jgi:hypothetical protein